jgi:hypothetical protein
VDADALRKQWEKISGNGSAYAVDVRAVTDPEGLCRYLAKDAGQQNAEEAGFRFWGVFGGVKPVVEEQVVGTLHDLAPLLRVARRLDDDFRRANGLPARHDDGKRGRILWDASAAFRKHLPALLTLFGIQARARDRLRRTPRPPEATGTKRCPGCSERKPRSEFYSDRAQTDGLHQYCRACKNRFSAERYQRFPFDAIARNFNRKAARLGVAGTVTGAELATIFTQDSGQCARCGSPERPHFDHVVSFACRGRNAVENIQLLCQRCSLRKGPKCIDFRGAVEK